MTTEPTAAVSRAERPLAPPSSAEKRAAPFSLLLALWSFGLLAVTATLRDPMLTAPIVGGGVPADVVDQWYAVAIPTVRGLVAAGYLGLAASAIWIRRVTGAGGLGLVAALGLGIEGASRASIVAGLAPGPVALGLAVSGLGMIGWIALLLAMSQTVRRFGRRYPIAPMFWAVFLAVANFSHEVVDATGRPELADYQRFTRLSWLVLTVTALAATIAVIRGRRAVLRALAGVPPSADAPPDRAVGAWLDTPGWAYLTDGLRVVSVGLLVQVAATGLGIGLLFATRAIHVELVFRTVVLVGAVTGGLSSLLMLAGAHGVAAGPRVAAGRLLAWLAAGVLIATLAGAGLSYSIALVMFEDALRAVEMAQLLLLADTIMPLAGYVALYALLKVALRVAEGFSEHDLARRARGFCNLTLFTALAASIYLVALRMNLGVTLQVLFGVLAVFMGVWLFVGSWSVLRKLAGAVETRLTLDLGPERQALEAVEKVSRGSF